MGGILFLLALVFAAVTGGGLVAFIFASIMLNIGRGIIRSIRTSQERRRVGAGRPPWRLEEMWETQQARRQARQQEQERERQRRRNRRAGGSSDATDDRYVRGRQPQERPALSDRSRASTPPARASSTSRAVNAAAPSTNHPHATEAVRRAGLNPDKAGLTLTDVGLIVYGAEPKPVVHRESAVPDTADYVQPFAVLNAVRAAKGTLTFELVDSSGSVVYRREEDQQLRAGKTSAIPRTRLPIGDHLDLSQGWTLNIYANSVLLAAHPFGWYNPANRTETLREVMSNDGELTADLTALMDDVVSQPMSLDDLLGDDSPPLKQARR